MRLFSNTLTFNRIKDGEDGKPGPSLVYAGAWREDVTYLKDDVINHYVHQVRNGKKEFYLLQSPQSLGDDPYLNNTQGSGDIWRRVEQHDLILARKIQSDEIDTSNLVARHIRTEFQGPRIEASGSEMHIYGQEEHPNIIFGVNSQGYAVLAYYANGEKIYDLGPSGLKMFDFAPARWTEYKYIKCADYSKNENNITFDDLSEATNPYKSISDSESYWKYYAGGHPSVTEEDREKEKYLYTRKSTDAAFRAPNGWYYTPPREANEFRTIPSGGTGEYVKPLLSEKTLYPNPLGVIDRHPIYRIDVNLVVAMAMGEVRTTIITLVWNGYSRLPDLP